VAKYGQMREDYVVLPGDQPRLVDPSLLPPARRYRHISDADFFSSLRLSLPKLAAVAKAVRAKRYDDAYCAWEAYYASDHAVPPYPPPEEQAEALAKDPSRQKSTIRTADDLISHKVHGGGGNSVQFGRKFKFNYIGPGGAYCHPYMSWLEPLAAAYLATGDGRYVACFDEVFNQWHDARDSLKPERGDEFHPVWNELSVAQVVRRWPTFYYIFRRSPALRPGTRRRLLKHILGNLRWLADHEQSLGFRGGNWQMIGTHALLFGSVSSGCWSTRGATSSTTAATPSDSPATVACASGSSARC